MIMNPAGMSADLPVDTWERLCLVVGGSNDSWSCRVLELFNHGDPVNRRRLGSAYPLEYLAWSLWKQSPEVPGWVERPWTVAEYVALWNVLTLDGISPPFEAAAQAYAMGIAMPLEEEGV